ncbi:hypothetical protein D3C80_1498750 [compost metagenome]
MAGMQRVKLAEHHADILLHPREFKPEETVQRLQLLRAGAFYFCIEKLAQVALGHAASFGHLLQRTAFLADRGFEIVK